MRQHRELLVAVVLTVAAAGWISVDIAHADRTGASERLTIAATTPRPTVPSSTSPPVLAPAPAAAPPLASSAQLIAADVAGAAAYAQQRAYTSGITVIDTSSGATYSGGDSTGYFASESVVKVLIATRLPIEGQMTGDTETTAYQMITQSDDTSADDLYGDVGGDDLINWADAYFGINIGAPPTEAGWWGNTHISSSGLAAFSGGLLLDVIVMRVRCSRAATQLSLVTGPGESEPGVAVGSAEHGRDGGEGVDPGLPSLLVVGAGRRSADDRDRRCGGWIGWQAVEQVFALRIEGVPELLGVVAAFA